MRKVNRLVRMPVLQQLLANVAWVCGNDTSNGRERYYNGVMVTIVNVISVMVVLTEICI